MCGSETLAMLVSSTSMNVAMETVTATSHGFTPGFAAEFGVLGMGTVVLVQWGNCWALANTYSGLDRHAWCEQQGRIVVCRNHNLDRNALNHLHEVAGRVFRRGDAET